MVEWWQALFLVLAGGLAGLPTAYAVNRWTTKASREAEERQAKRRLEEEQRQAIRQFRRERMQPVLEYLDIAKQFAARQQIGKALDQYNESLSPEDKLPPDRLESMKRRAFAADPAAAQRMRAISVALWSTMVVPALQRQLFKIWDTLRMSGDPKGLRSLGPALRSAEQLLEQYLAGAEPHEPTPDNPSQEA